VTAPSQRGGKLSSLDNTQDSQSTSFRDVKQMGLFAAIGIRQYGRWILTLKTDELQ